MITDSTIEILALKCNSQDLFNAKIIASTNQMISGDKKHTTVMGKTKTTSHRKQKKETAYGKHKKICSFVRKVVSRRGFLFNAMRSKSIEITPMDFNDTDVKIAINTAKKIGINCYYDIKTKEIRLNLKGIK